jgi:hypothetical protein
MLSALPIDPRNGIGVDLPAERIVPLREYVLGRRRYFLHCPWPRTEAFAVYECQTAVRNMVEEALALPNLVGRARADLERYARVLLGGGTAGRARSPETLAWEADDSRPRSALPLPPHPCRRTAANRRGLWGRPADVHGRRPTVAVRAQPHDPPVRTPFQHRFGVVPR